MRYMLEAVRTVPGMYQVLYLAGGGTGGLRRWRKEAWSSHFACFYADMLSSFSLWALIWLPPLRPSGLCGYGPLSVRTSSSHPQNRVGVLLCPNWAILLCPAAASSQPCYSPEEGNLAVLTVLSSGHRPCLARGRCLVNVLKKSGTGKLVEGQRANVVGFVGHMVSVATAQLCCGRRSVDSLSMKRGCGPVQFYLACVGFCLLIPELSVSGECQEWTLRAVVVRAW